MESKPAEGAGGPLDRHGPARAVFEANLGFFDLVISTLGIALLGAGLLAVGAWLLYVLHVQSRGGPPLLLALALALAGLVLLASAVAAGGRAWRMRNARVLVYAEGLIFRRGRQTLEIRWDKVRDVLQGATRRDLHPKSLRGSIRASIRRGRGTQQYVLVRSDNERIRFGNDFPRIGELWVIVQEETFKHLWPAYVAAFSGGEKLFFGALRAERGGLHKRSEFLPWSAVKSIDIDDLGQLLIRTGIYTWLADAAGEYANIHVLRALAEHVRVNRSDQAANVDMLRDLVTHARVDPAHAEGPGNPPLQADAKVIDSVFQAGYAPPRGKEEKTQQ